MIARLLTVVRERWRCWLFGHADALRVERGRMWLRCMQCGLESEGLTLSPAGEAGDRGSDD